MIRRRAAWAVPAVVIGAVVAAGLVPSIASGSGHPPLPTRTAAELLVAVEGSQTQHLSGTVVETARLGLPDLPGSERSASLDWQSLVAGSHTARVWIDGTDRQRLALIGPLAESDVVHNGNDVWTYSSADNAVTHATLPADSADSATPRPAEVPLTPADAAAKALAAVEPTTVVTVDATQEIAGRSAYTLSLQPRDSRSTVRQVLIAVDAETSVPLRVQVFGAATKAAFETAFTDISFSRPSADAFAFTPPRGSVVTEQDLAGRAGQKPPGAPTSAPKTTVVGDGWTSVLAVAAPTDAGSAASSQASASVLDQLTRTLPDGDRLLTTSLVNALLTKDGRVFVGAVTPDLLQKAAGSTG